jgi:AraC-like DNA-binding protein
MEDGALAFHSAIGNRQSAITMPQHAFHTIYASETVNIVDVCCRARRDADDPRREERSGAHEVVFTRGGAFVKHVAGREVLADANHVIFFNAGEPYRVTHPIDGGDDCTVFRFAPGLLRDAIAEHDGRVRDRPESPFAHTHGPARPAELLRQHVCRAAARHGDLETDELAIELLGAVLDGAYAIRGQRTRPRRATTSRAHRDVAHATQALLNAHFAEPMDLAEVARRVYASPYHLARLFRRETGCSIHQYRARLRLAASLERLADGACDLTGLALDLGYSSHAHFADAFRRALGITPSGFRRTAFRARLREMSTKLKA